MKIKKCLTSSRFSWWLLEGLLSAPSLPLLLVDGCSSVLCAACFQKHSFMDYISWNNLLWFSKFEKVWI